MITAPHVVLGLGGCVDFELRLSPNQLEDCARTHGISSTDLVQPPTIASERDLVISILSHMRDGSGGEYRVESLDLITAFSDRFDKVVTLGGTSVRAGLAMSRLKVPSTLHLVCFNEHFRSLLPDDVDYLCSGYPDAVFPHLIVQYGSRPVRLPDAEIRAPHANRLIYVNDPANEQLRISTGLGPLLSKCEVFLLSGFNAIIDDTILAERLSTTRRHLQQLPTDAVVYYEDAPFHRPAHNRRVRDALLDAIDIYGLNEDELQAHLGRRVDIYSPADVHAAMIDLRTLIPARTLVLHTAFWSAALGPRASRLADALDEGMTAATTRFRRGDDFSQPDLAQTSALPRHPQALVFAAELAERIGDLVCCRAGFDVQVHEPTTVGLGDTFVGGFLAVLARRRSNRATAVTASPDGVPAR